MPDTQLRRRPKSDHTHAIAPRSTPTQLPKLTLAQTVTRVKDHVKFIRYLAKL